jgi:hypothetical protein
MPGPNVFARADITGQQTADSFDLHYSMQTHTGFPFGSTGNIDLHLIPEPSAISLLGIILLAGIRRIPKRLT